MVILGIHDGHNASAALMVDGKIIAMVSEERFTYRKNEYCFPVRAIGECFRIAGINGKSVDVAAFSAISLPLHYMKVKRECLFTIRDWIEEQELYWKPRLFENRINQDYFKYIYSIKRLNEGQTYDLSKVTGPIPDTKNRIILEGMRKKALNEVFGITPGKVRSYDHHLCHAYYAYFGSPYRKGKTLIFTADGGGDGINGTISLADNEKITELGRNNATDMGRLYRYLTLLLGMKMGEHEFKVMGLAPYSSEYELKRCQKVFKDIFHVPDLLVEYKNRPKDLYFYFKEALAECRFDGIAAGVQEMVEEAGREWFSKCTRKLKVNRVVFSGGLAMNVKLNKVISELDTVKDFYSPASGGDESASLGACYVAGVRDSKIPVESIENNYLGPRIIREDILNKVAKLKKYKIKEHVTNKDIAKLLAKNVVIGRFFGRMEFGARSLGNRSILANPSNQEIVKKINSQIKFRDFWMPFAPSIPDKYTHKYIVNPKNLLSDHMTNTFDTTPLGRKVLIAAIHPADYTVRPHIVRKELNPEYYDLIERFADLTGIGALLNTSFNLHGYPIVCYPEHAVHVFDNSSLDAMVLEDILVTR